MLELGLDVAECILMFYIFASFRFCIRSIPSLPFSWWIWDPFHACHPRRCYRLFCGWCSWWGVWHRLGLLLYFFPSALLINMFEIFLGMVMVTFLSLVICWRFYFLLLLLGLWLWWLLPRLKKFLVCFCCAGRIWLFLWSALILFSGCIRGDTCIIMIL